MSTECRFCKAKFPSRNYLFQHLRQSECRHLAQLPHRPEFEKVVLIFGHAGGRQHASVQPDPLNEILRVLGPNIEAGRREPPRDSDSDTPRGATKKVHAVARVVPIADAAAAAVATVVSLNIDKNTGDVVDDDRGLGVGGSGIDGGSLPLCDAVNRLLPPQFRLWSCLPVSMSFHAERCCVGMRYEILLPLALAFPTDLVSRCRAGDELGSGVIPPPEGYSAPTKKRWAGPNIPEYSTSCGVRVSRGAAHALCKRLKPILKRFVGVHKFHNFTRRCVPDDDHVTRSIVKFIHSRPVTVTRSKAAVGGGDGDCHVEEECLCFRISSDVTVEMLRHIMGAVIAVLHGAIDESYISLALGPKLEPRNDANYTRNTQKNDYDSSEPERGHDRQPVAPPGTIWQMLPIPEAPEHLVYLSGCLFRSEFLPQTTLPPQLNDQLDHFVKTVQSSVVATEWDGDHSSSGNDEEKGLQRRDAAERGESRTAHWIRDTLLPMAHRMALIHQSILDTREDAAPPLPSPLLALSQTNPAKLTSGHATRSSQPPPTVYARTLQALRAVYDAHRWPDTSKGRRRVIRDAEALGSSVGSGSFTMGTMAVVGPYGHQPEANDLFPQLLEAVFELEGLLLPDRPPSSAVAVNRNCVFKPHRDSGAGAGQGSSLIVGLGDYERGELVVEGEVKDIRYNPVLFDGCEQRHWTKDFEGERYSLVWFTPVGCADKCGISLPKQIRS